MIINKEHQIFIDLPTVTIKKSAGRIYFDQGPHANTVMVIHFIIIETINGDQRTFAIEWAGTPHKDMENDIILTYQDQSKT